MNKKIIGLIFILFVITTGCSKETNVFEGNLDFDTLIEKHKDDYSQQLGYKYFLMSPSPNENEEVEDIYKLNSYLIKVTNEREIVNIYTLDQYYDIFDYDGKSITFKNSFNDDSLAYKINSNMVEKIESNKEVKEPFIRLIDGTTIDIVSSEGQYEFINPEPTFNTQNHDYFITDFGQDIYSVD